MNYILPPFFINKKPFTQLLYLLLFIIGGAFLFVALAQVLGLLIWQAAPSTLSVSYLRFVQAFSTIGAFLVPAFLFSYCSERDFFSYSLSYRLPGKEMTVIVMVISLFIIPIVSILAHWNQQIHLPELFSGIEQWMQEQEEAANRIIELMTADPSISTLFINLLIMAILPAVAEEYLFRGTIQPFLSGWLKNKTAAIWITAFIFSAIHLQFYGFIPRFLLGAYLGYLFVWSGSIWLPVIAHFLQNSCSIILSFIAQREGMDIEQLSPTDIPFFYPIALFSVIIFSLGIVLLRRIYFKKIQ